MSVGNLPMSRSQEIRYRTCNPHHDMIHTHTLLCTPPHHTHTQAAMPLLSSVKNAQIFPSFSSPLPCLCRSPCGCSSRNGVCAGGAAGMAITVHGSLGESCTHCTRMKGARGEDESQREVRTLKNTNRVNERGRQR